ncbi:hypothetical protein LINGRAPRIM_LOCUS259 [Linum grandiflorum]
MYTTPLTTDLQYTNGNFDGVVQYARNKRIQVSNLCMLALQEKEKLTTGAFYFDRAEAPKHLALAATRASHSLIGYVVDTLQSLAKLP